MIANLVEPGKVIAKQTRDRLITLYAGEAEQRGETVQAIRNQSAPLQLFADLVPENLVASMSKNKNLLQVVLAAIMLGVALLKIPPRKSKPVVLFFEGINDAIIELIRFIMKLAPIGVFSLVASLLVEVAGNSKPNDIF
jgi:proton glutamate symport protein